MGSFRFAALAEFRSDDGPARGHEGVGREEARLPEKTTATKLAAARAYQDHIEFFLAS
jgi:hypothetical protein